MPEGTGAAGESEEQKIEREKKEALLKEYGYDSIAAYDASQKQIGKMGQQLGDERELSRKLQEENTTLKNSQTQQPASGNGEKTWNDYSADELVDLQLDNAKLFYKLQNDHIQSNIQASSKAQAEKNEIADKQDAAKKAVAKIQPQLEGLYAKYADKDTNMTVFHEEVIEKLTLKGLLNPSIAIDDFKYVLSILHPEKHVEVSTNEYTNRAKEKIKQANVAVGTGGGSGGKENLSPIDGVDMDLIDDDNYLVSLVKTKGGADKLREINSYKRERVKGEIVIGAQDDL